MTTQQERLEALETIDDVVGAYMRVVEELRSKYAKEKAEGGPFSERLSQLNNQIEGTVTVLERLHKVRSILSEDMDLYRRQRRTRKTEGG